MALLASVLLPSTGLGQALDESVGDTLDPVSTEISVPQIEKPVVTGTNGFVLPPTADPIEMMRRDTFLRVGTNSLGELTFNYAHFSGTNAAPPPPIIEISEQGAIARQASHMVEFDGNLNAEDAIVIHMPGGQVLKARPAALSISDDAGHRVWLGELKDCEGNIPENPGNQVLYADAFTGIKADVLFTYDWNYIEQDIILREQPALPNEIDVQSARLEVWTAVYESPEPQKSTKALKFRDGSQLGLGPDKDKTMDDETLDFGSMHITHGNAFRSEAGKFGTDKLAPRYPVIKRWVKDGTEAFLMEAVDYLSLNTQLEKLDHARAQAMPVGSSKTIAFLTDQAKARRMLRKDSKRVAASSPVGRTTHEETPLSTIDSRPGVVIDYIMVNTSLLDIDFGLGCTGNYGFVYKTANSDFWIDVKTPTFSYPNLKYSDQTLSGISLDVANANGHWCISCTPGYPTITSKMFSDYIYPPSGGNTTLTLNNIPTGTYDFYIYGAWGGVFDPVNNPYPNGKYVLSVAGAGQGLKQTFLNPGWDVRANSGNWVQGEHYVLYANVNVTAGQSVVITAQPGGSAIGGGNIAVINGLQMIRSGSGMPVVQMPTDTLTYGEGQSPIFLDPSAQSTVTDSDSTDFNGGSLTVSYYAGAQQYEDRLSILSQGQISVNASPPEVRYGGTLIGTWSGGPYPSLVVNFNANANATIAQAVLRNLQYQDTYMDNPALNSRSFAITVNDGDGGASLNVYKTVNVVSVNDPPTFTPGGNVLVIQGSGQYSSQWTTSVSPGPYEVGQSVSFLISGNSNPGIFSSGPTISGSGVLTFTPSASVNGSSTISVYAQDTGGTANGGVNMSGVVNFSITVQPVGGQPTAPSPSLAASFNTDHSSATVTDTTGGVIAGWVRYTIDGTDPLSAGSSTPPTFSVPTTVKAKAFPPGYFASATVSLTVSQTAQVIFSPASSTGATGPVSVGLSSESGASIFYRLGTPPTSTTSGLKGYWSMNEGTGLAAGDGSGNGFDGTLNGAAWTSGQAASALNFDGNDIVQVGPPNGLVMTSALTISAWIYPLDNSWAIVVNKEGEYEVGLINGSVQWAFANASPGWAFMNTGLSVPLNQWTHLAGTYDSSAGALKTYINGSLGNTYYISGPIGDVETTKNDFRIGGRQWIDQYFRGTIDEVRIYNRALTAVEIGVLATPPSPWVNGSSATVLDNGGGPVQAYAFTSGKLQSQVATSGSYNFKAAQPTISSALKSNGTQVTDIASSSTSGASIYYTTSPTATPSTAYTGGTTGQDLNAIDTTRWLASKSAYDNSEIVTQLGVPSFSPSGGTFNNGQMVTITASTGGQLRVIQLNPNLLNPSVWTVGVQGNQPPFYYNGDITETAVEWRTTPYWTTDKLWVAKNMDNDNIGESYRDGGFFTDNVLIDATKLYRFSIWVRKVDNTPTTTSGTTYFGPGAGSSVSTLTGTSTDTIDPNPYFWTSGLPVGAWYLLVGYVHPAGYAGTVADGKIYDTQQNIIGTMTDFRWLSGATGTYMRAYFLECTEAGVQQEYWNPRIEIVSAVSDPIDVLFQPVENSPKAIPLTGWAGTRAIRAVSAAPPPTRQSPVQTAVFSNPDNDVDGLPDQFEIYYFGNTTSQNGTGDPDGDGLPNSWELALELNPLQNDSQQTLKRREYGYDRLNRLQTVQGASTMGVTLDEEGNLTHFAP